MSTAVLCRNFSNEVARPRCRQTREIRWQPTRPGKRWRRGKWTLGTEDGLRCAAGGWTISGFRRCRRNWNKREVTTCRG